ncbi:MAG: phenylacetate--CoA ligase family protein [Deltaproteobacteria bacterium]|nr:phenylacetate--CoA ligase family protein [Deltaproteobacteria bacterium]
MALQRLRPLLAHAVAHVPYYRDLFERTGIRPSDIKTVADLARLPLTGKSDLRSGFPAGVVADNLPASRRFKMQTSGSTGLPFDFYADRTDLDRRIGSFLLFWEWAGAPVGDGVVQVVVSLRPTVTVQSASRWVQTARRFVGEQVMHVSGIKANPSELLARVSQLSSRSDYLLWGLPSSIARIAVGLLDRNNSLAKLPRVVISTGESLTAADASVIVRAFRCPIVNHYSAYEVLHLAQTCPDNPELLHINSERAILRVVRADGSTAAPAESGRIVITDLGNWIMPFINYEIGDWAEAGSMCPCGRGFPTLRNVEGRLGEIIRTPAGKMISPVTLGWFLAHVRQTAGYIWEFQAIQTAADAIVLHIVPTARFTAEFAQDLERGLEEFLGGGMAVKVEKVDRIELEASGKRLVIKSELISS